MNDLIVGIPSEGLEYQSDIPCTREDEALAIAFGAWLAGKRPLAFMQDTGFIDSLNVYLSLIKTYGAHKAFPIKIDCRISPEHHFETGDFFEKIGNHIFNNERNNR